MRQGLRRVEAADHVGCGEGAECALADANSGLSHASPIVWDNYIFVITAISGDSKQVSGQGSRHRPRKRRRQAHLDDLRLDKRNGKVLWNDKPYEGVPRAKRHVKATQTNSTPGNRRPLRRCAFRFRRSRCLRHEGQVALETGSRRSESGTLGRQGIIVGTLSSPIIYRDLVIVQADGHKQSFIAAFNLKDGKQAWRVERNEITSWTTPTIYQGKDRRN